MLLIATKSSLTRNIIYKIDLTMLSISQLKVTTQLYTLIKSSLL